MLLGLCALVLASALAFPACLCSHRMINKAIGLPASISESIRAKNKESICPHKVLEDNEYIVANIQNLDGSPDYLYAAFDDGGYAFFFKETLEMLEYCPSGGIDWPGDPSFWCYGGPQNYWLKDGEEYFNIVTGEIQHIENENAIEFAEAVRTALREKHGKLEKPVSSKAPVCPKIFALSPSSSSKAGTGAPNMGDDPISLHDGTFIPNYRYFWMNPIHGQNSSSFCGAVAAQLLLSYHNYYSDRRIIPDNYLYGDSSTNSEQNPNYCSDPMSMTSWTLGTRSYTENGSDARNYYAYLKTFIGSNAPIGTVRSGIENAIDQQGRTFGGFDYDLEFYLSNWWFGWQTISTSYVQQEIDRGRPSILLMQSSLGAEDHYVVAYGYADYTYIDLNATYSGFVADFGWDASFNKCWLNAVWVCGYVTLKFNHVHEYSYYGPIGTTGRSEYRCAECGHRTDAVVHIASNERHHEFNWTIPSHWSQEANLSRYFYVTFEKEGFKAFQTFGPADMDLDLFDLQYNLLASGGDDGFGSNAYFGYTVAASTHYWLRVRFNGTPSGGLAKIGISATNPSYTTYNGILHLSTAGSTGCTWNTSAYCTKPITFTPQEDGDYKFLVFCTSGFDVYFYVVDPVSLAASSHAGDVASTQASIVLSLVSGRRYLVLAMTKQIINATGFMGITISRQS